MTGGWRGSKHVLTVAAALLLLAPAAGSTWSGAAAQSTGSSGEYRLLQGAIDVHLHIDPDMDDRSVDAVDIAKMKFARAQGLRGFVLKNHYGSTDALAYLIRKEIPGVEAFGGVVLNRNQGGINPAMVEYMATSIKGRPGRFVWMPTYDAENYIRRSKEPDRPFVHVARNGELLPEVKQVI